MARSYFSRVLQSSAPMKGALAPERPVSNLWKSARIDWMAGEAAADLPSKIGFRDGGRRGRVDAPRGLPMAGIEPESRGDARVGSARYGESVGRELVREENVVLKAGVRARSKASLPANAGEVGSEVSQTPRKRDATQKYNSLKDEAGMLPSLEPVRGHQSDFGQQDGPMRSDVRRSDLGRHPKPAVVGDRDGTLESSERS